MICGSFGFQFNQALHHFLIYFWSSAQSSKRWQHNINNLFLSTLDILGPSWFQTEKPKGHIQKHNWWAEWNLSPLRLSVLPNTIIDMKLLTFLSQYNNIKCTHVGEFIQNLAEILHRQPEGS